VLAPGTRVAVESGVLGLALTYLLVTVLLSTGVSAVVEVFVFKDGVPTARRLAVRRLGALGVLMPSPRAGSARSLRG
jgi:uncharacterized membrane protein YedE/YeeE